MALLNAWEQKEGEGATFLKLAEALHHRGRADYVVKLCEKIKTVKDHVKVLDKSTPPAGIDPCKISSHSQQPYDT